MRNEQQVLDQLLAFARQDELIRAVVMNGSRVNPNVTKDLFCDYDVVYYVTDPEPFLQDQRWIATFGELVMLQQNDFDNHGVPGHIFLMLFLDGVRIDLCFAPLVDIIDVPEDSLAVVLLDKDGRIGLLPPSSDAGYIVQRPTRKEFDETINEIFWCSNNVAKGIWRDELTYVKFMYDSIIRVALLQVLAWYAASQHDWAIGTGKFGKWLKQFLPAEVYESLEKTYAGVDYEETWDALFEALRLTRKMGIELAEELGYQYPIEDDCRTVQYLQHVRSLPKDAISFD